MARERASQRKLAGAVGAAVIALSSFESAPARANGRYPLANQLAVAPSSPSRLVARTTFGLLESSDSGASWQWICEQAISPEGFRDPTIAITEDGRTLVATSHGVAISSDGCDWHASTGLDETRFMVDFALDPGRTGRAVALASHLVGADQSLELFESLDDGESWSMWASVDLSDVGLTTLDVAASGSVYLAGIRPSTGEGAFVAINADGSVPSVTSFPLPSSANAFVAAVDPMRSERVYLRTTAGALGDSHLLVTDDAGASFRELLSVSGDLDGFALSPDGAWLAAGGSGGGLNVADLSTFSFEKTNPIGPLCLSWASAGLYVCAKEAQDQQTIGLSTDRGSNVTALLHLDQVSPLVCAADAQQTSACRGSWPDVAATLGIESEAAASRTAIRGTVGADAVGAHSGAACSLSPRHGSPAERAPDAALLGVIAWRWRRRAKHCRRSSESLEKESGASLACRWVAWSLWTHAARLLRSSGEDRI